MRVLYITSNYPTESLPYSGIFIHRQVKKLQQLGCEIDVINPMPWVPLPLKKKFVHYSCIPAEEVHDGVKVWHPRYVRPSGQWYRSFEGLAFFLGAKQLAEKLMEEKRYALVHSHWEAASGILGLHLQQGFGIPHVCSVRGISTGHLNSLPWLDRILRRKVLASATCVLSVNRALARFLIQEKVRPEVQVVYNGVDGTIFYPCNGSSQGTAPLSATKLRRTHPDGPAAKFGGRSAATRPPVGTDGTTGAASTPYVGCESRQLENASGTLSAFGSAGCEKPAAKSPKPVAAEAPGQARGPADCREDHPKITFLFAGSLEPHKGILDVLAAFRNVAKKSERFNLLVVGDGSLRKEVFERVQSYGIGNQVKLQGVALPHQMGGFYRQSDVFVFPGHGEYLPNVIVEAGACGLPTIAYDIPQSNEFVIHEQTGIRVSPKTPEALSQAMLRLGNDPLLLKRCGEKALDYSTRAFGLDHCVRQLLDIYETLACEP